MDSNSSSNSSSSSSSSATGSGVCDEANLRHLLDNIRSDEELKRSSTIGQIPVLLLESMKNKNPILNQLLLVIYNLNTAYPDQNFEIINAANRSLIFRHLLRLYTDTIHEHRHSQLEALTQITSLVGSSELLVELAHVFYRCSRGSVEREEDAGLVEEALGSIQDKAASSLSLEALLMVHSIVAIK